MTLPRLSWLPIGIALAFLAGCTERTVSLTGKLVLPAKMKLEANDSLTVTFIPDAATGKPAIAPVSASDRTFTASNIAPGSYKITVNVTPYMGEKNAKARADALQDFNKQFGPTSKLKYDVTGEAGQSITIDTTNSTVKKG